MSDLIPVVGTLGGTVVGALAGMSAQWLEHRRRNRAELLAFRRSIYVAFLGAAHELFEATRRCYREHPDDPDERVRSLSRLSTTSCRIGLDQIRIAGDARSVNVAEDLLHHLRHSGVSRGTVGSARLRRWTDDYWTKRHAYVAAVRGELGLSSGDYEIVRQSSGP